MKWFSLLAALLIATPGARSEVEPGAVATVHPLATDAGLAALKRGGNAIDAAVAAALTLGVVDAQNSGIGGGCFMLIRLADGKVIGIDGRERAPAAATRDMFVRDGKAVPALSQTGVLAIATPGALAAYDYALRHFGKRPLAEHLERAAEIADNGFKIGPRNARAIESVAKELHELNGTKAVFVDDEGRAVRAGEILKQPDLAFSYRSIARHGTPWFYDGTFPQAVALWMRSAHGLLTEYDFRQYSIRLREPIQTRYRGFEIVGFPPPSSGGVHVAQILNILEEFDLKALGPDSPDFIHIVTEAMKLAFADRAWWLGDPDYVAVPAGLVSRSYARQLAARIDRSRASSVEDHGTPPDATGDIFGKHTTHFSAADTNGNWVACTATINTTFGSRVVIPGTGIVMNNEMDDFSAQPGTPNFFGLVGSAANAVEPGKRPLSSMSPTIVLRDGRPVLAVGGAGGPTIISQTLLAIINVVDFGMDPAKALAQPRFHHQWRPDELKLERSIGEKVARELEKRGHRVSRVDSIGVSQAVGWDAAGGRWISVTEPRLK